MAGEWRQLAVLVGSISRQYQSAVGSISRQYQLAVGSISQQYHDSLKAADCRLPTADFYL